MAWAGDDAALRAIAAEAKPLSATTPEFGPVLDLVGDARVVLVGEATHGTHEFYRLRAELTKRLIRERGFRAIAAEADWPDAYRVNRSVRGMGRDHDAADALGDFQRFPQWMWRNADVLDFAGWLREWNDERPSTDRAGFYGLDLYSLHASMDAVLRYLDQVDPEAAARARRRYGCFGPAGDDPQLYGQAATLGLTPGCEREAVNQLVELQRSRQQLLEGDGLAAKDEHFQAEQNARVVRDAEKYYQTMFQGRVSSWNLRDTHMADTLDALLDHLERRRCDEAKVVVWAHNSHVGDARATQMGAQGEVNIGQLARERHPGATRLIGFSTFHGTVTATSELGGPAERKKVRDGLAGSYEEFLHRVGRAGFVLPLVRGRSVTEALAEPRLQRAIGVLYLPDTERQSHYFHALLPAQFDAILHLDHTRALEPLERSAGWETGEAPETWPTGL